MFYINLITIFSCNFLFLLIRFNIRGFVLAPIQNNGSFMNKLFFNVQNWFTLQRAYFRASGGTASSPVRICRRLKNTMSCTFPGMSYCSQGKISLSKTLPPIMLICQFHCFLFWQTLILYRIPVCLMTLFDFSYTFVNFFCRDGITINQSVLQTLYI